MEDKWAKLEEIVRRVIREEIAGLRKKPKIELVNGKFVGVSADQMEAWKAAYPGVDIDAEMRRAAAWCVSNPAAAPKSDYARYINSWLGREQNRLALRSIPVDRKTEVQIKQCAYCERKATGNVNGIDACDSHTQNAMDGERPPRLKLA
jgi:hypothetical protein